jgi:RNA polymerase sigma factor (sigma-70 family)
MASPDLTRVLEHLRRLPTRGADGVADQQLLTRFVAGRDGDAFTALMQRHGPMVVGVCRRLLREPHDVEDAFQATFLVLARKAGSIRKGESLGSWLHGVALRVARKIRLEAARRTRRERQRPAPEPAETGDALTWGELRSLLDEELGRLPAGWRAPLILCYLEGRTQDEAARQLGWSKSTLRRRLERGRRLLQCRLAGRGVTLSAGLFAPLLSTAEASAALPRALTAATVKAALGLGGRQLGTQGAARPVALADGVLKGMGLTPGKLAAVLLLSVGLLALAGLGACWAVGDKKPAPAVAEAPTGDLPGEQAKPALAPGDPVDQLGDPLPADALARLGTIRLRHGAIVQALTFAPDGRSLASAGHDGTIHIWVTTTGKELLRIENQEFPGIGLGAVAVLAYSPDGKTLAGTRINQPPCLWDVATGKELRQFGGPANRADWLAFSPDGKYLAYGRGHQEPFIIRIAEVKTGKDLCQYEGTWLVFSPDGKTLAYGGPVLDGQFRANPVIRVAEVSSGKEPHQLGGHKGGLAAFSPDGKTLATADRHMVRFFDLATGRVRELPRPEGQGVGLQPLIFSPDGKTLAATGGGQKTIRLMEVATGKTIRTIELDGKREPVRALLFTHDSKRVISAHEDGYVRFWDAATGAKANEFRAHYVPVLRIALSPGGQTLATTGHEHGLSGASVSLWETATGKPLVRHPGAQAGIAFLTFSSDSRRVATASWDGAVRLWEAATGKLLRRWEVFGPVAFTPDGRTLIRGGWSDGEVRFLDVTTGKVTRQFKAHPKNVSSLALARDGKLLVTAGGDGFLRLWDLATGRMIQDFGGQQKGHVWGLALSPDGRSLASIHDGKTVRLWDTATGKPVREHEEQGQIQGIAFSPDGKFVASSFRSAAVAEDQFIRLRDAATGIEIRRLPGNNLRPLEHLAFSPDGRTLIVGGQSYKDLYLWEVATGQLRRQFSGHQGHLARLAFSPDGRMMASGSSDGSVLIWDAAGRRSRLAPAAAPLSADQLDSLWADLAARDAVTAYRAICALRAAPRQAAALLERHLKPVPRADAKRLAAAIRDLSSAQFTVRNRAMKELEAVAEAAEPAVRQALGGKPSEEVRRRLEQLLERLEGVEELRRARALEVLEQSDSPESRRVLTALAQGAPEARRTRAAQAALDRMGR